MIEWVYFSNDGELVKKGVASKAAFLLQITSEKLDLKVGFIVVRICEGNTTDHQSKVMAMVIDRLAPVSAG
jgi:hypothetical protein